MIICFTALTTVASANAYHFVSSASESKQLSDFPIISLQVRSIAYYLFSFFLIRQYLGPVYTSPVRYLLYFNVLFT